MKSIHVLESGRRQSIGDLGASRDLHRRHEWLRSSESLFRRVPPTPEPEAATLRRALELRYQVYCLERGFLPRDAYPNGEESDEHDETATHFYAHDQFGDLVGYVRLVYSDDLQQFPFQRHCPPLSDGMALPMASQAAEVSRLIVRGDFRRLRNTVCDDSEVKLADTHRCSRRQDSRQILLNLYKQMYAYSQTAGIQYWYAAMERPLARALQFSNFAFRPVGPQSDYYGPVAPYLADLRVLEGQLQEVQPDLLNWLRQSEGSFLGCPVEAVTQVA